MLSVVNLGATAQALKYYQQDNYYANEDQSLDDTQWYGRGAEALDLNNEKVNAEDFENLLDGKVDGQQLGRIRKDDKGVAYVDHRPAMDLTFSAPKSVSIMAEVFQNQDILNAHQEAVKQTLDYLEENNIQTRISLNGKMEKVTSDNLIVALFNHNTSRALDPQTHTHAVVMNATINEKNEWSSISNEAIYDSQSLLGSIYNSNLANNLQNIGLDIEIKDSKGNFEISGFTPEMIDEFSQRRQQIKESLAERGIDIDSASAHTKEQATIKTRERKEAVNEQDLQESWKERATTVGIDYKFVAEITQKIETTKQQNFLKEIQVTDQNSHPVKQEDNTILKPDFRDPKEFTQPQTTPNLPDNSTSNFTSKSSENLNIQDVPIERFDPQNHTDFPNDSFNEPEWLRESEPYHELQDANDLPQEPDWLNEQEPQLQNNSHNIPGKKATVTLPSKKNVSSEIEITQATKEIVFAAIGHHLQRETMFNQKAVLSTALKLGIGKTNERQVQAEIERLKKDNIVIQVGNKITTRKQAEQEIWSINHIKSEQGVSSPILNKDEVSQRLDQEQKLREHPFTQGQKSSLELILTSENRYIAVQGLAGTGKTTMLHALKKIANENGIVVKGMAPTGIAQKKLQEETGIETNTVATFLIKENKQLEQLESQGEMSNKKNEIWIVDENSMTNQNDWNELLTVSKLADSRIVFLGDIHQLKSINAGKPFELSQKKESLEVGQMNEILRQKDKGLIDTVAVIVAKNAEGKIDLSRNKEAYEMLEKQNRIQEVKPQELKQQDKVVNKDLIDKYVKPEEKIEKDKNQLDIQTQDVHKALVKDYMQDSAKDRENSLVITPFNADRIILNSMIREKMKANNELQGDDFQHNTLINKNLTDAFKKFEMNYELNDVLLFQKTVVDKIANTKIEKGEYLTVVMKNSKEGVLILENKQGDKIKWNPKRGGVEVYQEHKRDLSAGDTIRFTRTDSVNEIKNGERFKVEKVSNGIIHIKDPEGKEKQLELDKLKHWDHGYVTTIYSSQSLTKDKVFVLLNSSKLQKDLKNDRAAVKVLGKAFGSESFYVAVTRAQHDLKIYTDDSEKSKEAITFKQDKTSFFESIENNQPPIPEHQINNEQIPLSQHEIDL